MLEIYNNRTPLDLSDENKAKIQRIIKKTIDSLAFMSQRISDGADMNDVHTHMSLLEYAVNDLTPLTHYDSVLAEEVERRHKKIRELNQRVHELETQMGRKVTADAVSAAIRRYEDVFRAWYQAAGIRYAKIDYTSYSLKIEICSNELDNHQRDRLTTNKELCKKLAGELPFIAESPDWDVVHDHYTSELLDTDRNRENITNLLKKYFPNVRIFSFNSYRNDFESFSLRCCANVPYTDIEALEKKFTQE